VSRAGSQAGILTEKRTTRGYVYIDLARNGVKKRVLVHTLVASAFVSPKPSNRHQVNHINGVKHDNVPDNLEWVTSSENNLHAFATGLRKPPNLHGERNTNAKLTVSQVSEIRALVGKEPQRSVAKRYGICKSMVGNIQRGDAWKCLPSEWPEDLRVQEFPKEKA